MKTEFYAGQGMYNKCIKTLEGVIIPAMPEGAIIEIDDHNYRVRSYSLIITGNEVTAHFKLE